MVDMYGTYMKEEEKTKVIDRVWEEGRERRKKSQRLLYIITAPTKWV